MDTVDPKSVWRQYLKHPPAEANLTIAIAGSMTAEPLAPYLGAHLLAKGFKPDIVIGPFNQLHRTCLDPKAVLGDKSFDVIILLWRLEDMFPDLLDKPDLLLLEVEKFLDAVRTLRANFTGTLIISTPPSPTPPVFDVQDLGQPLTGGFLHRKILDVWIENITAIDHTHILDLHGLMMKAGMDTALDARKWLLYYQPYTEFFWRMIGTQLGRITAAQTLSARKCLVLDADNTLWGGIVGEDGLEGLQLGNDFPGSAYREFQKYVLSLKQKGVLLAIASKNNPEDFFEAFDTHDAMILKRSDIAVFEIHWESKIESLSRIAKTLNIGTNALVFIDDSAKEIGEVQERMPEVACLMVPEEIALFPEILKGSDLFDSSKITDEDRKRTERIADEHKRKHLQETLSESDFKAALGLKIHVFQAEKQHISRITQLINKSNQFNLTTIRRTQDEVEALTLSVNHLVLGMELKDKYGDYGLVGVAILEKQDAICIIDTFLMSCRALGRNAEDTFMAQIAESARNLGCHGLRGTYIQTDKNDMVRDLYKNFGFSETPEGWLISPTSIIKNFPEGKPAHGMTNNLQLLTDQILAENPLHKSFLTSAIKLLTQEEICNLEDYILFCLSKGLGVAYLAESYLICVGDTLREQIYFQKTGKYRYSTFAEVADSVYFDKDYMAHYMYGLALTSFLWPNHLAMFRFFKNTLPRNKKGQYLEIGPGHGCFIRAAMEASGYDSFLGIDISETSINQTRALLEHYRGDRPAENIHLKCMDFLSSDLPPASFDAIVMGEVLEHVEQPDIFLRRIATLARAGAYIFVTTCINAPAVDHIYLFKDIQQLEKLFAACGLKIKEQLIRPYEGKNIAESLEMRLSINVAYVLEKT
jgi:FkbH-like protein